MTDISHWFKNVPQFTRFWLTATLGVSIIGRFGMIPPRYLPLYYEPFVHGLQVSA